MATFKDESGADVEAFTQEEVQAKIDAAIAEAKKTETPQAPANSATGSVDVEAITAAILKQVEEKTGQLVQGGLKSDKLETVKSTVASTLDADTRKVFEEKFNNLTVGYEDTPEGYTKRANDAYMLATGKPPAMDFGLSNMMAPMAKSSVPASVTTELDKGIRAALGISDADAEKFGKK